MIQSSHLSSLFYFPSSFDHGSTFSSSDWICLGIDDFLLFWSWINSFWWLLMFVVFWQFYNSISSSYLSNCWSIIRFCICFLSSEILYYIAPLLLPSFAKWTFFFVVRVCSSCSSRIALFSSWSCICLLTCLKLMLGSSFSKSNEPWFLSVSLILLSMVLKLLLVVFCLIDSLA